uniref:Tail protein n=1 Tax=viral metagenome TaxID=1070528 RepID=A0A6M3LB46_9ZZZZ
MSILSDAELSLIASEIRSVIGDDSVGTTINFYLSGTTVNSWSPTSQLMPAMYSSSGVSAFRGSYSVYEVAESGGMIEYGDVKFIMMADDVSGVLTTIDKVWESGTTWQSATTYTIRNIVRDPLNICYFMQARMV